MLVTESDTEDTSDENSVSGGRFLLELQMQADLKLITLGQDFYPRLPLSLTKQRCYGRCIFKQIKIPASFIWKSDCQPQ